MRTYDVKGLKILNRTVSDKTEGARARRLALDAELADLDSAESKRKYTSQHLAAQKAVLRREVLRQLKDINTELDELTSQARKERHQWSRESLLADQYADTDATDKQGRALESIQSSIRRLELSARLPRMKDDMLTAFAERSAASGDGMAVILAGEEGLIRGGLVGAQCKKVLDDLPCEPAEQAEIIYAELAGHLNEVEALERLVRDPADKTAYVRVRVAEIKLGSGQDADKTEDTAEQAQPTQQPENGDSEPAADGLNGGVSIVNPTTQ